MVNGVWKVDHLWFSGSANPYTLPALYNTHIKNCWTRGHPRQFAVASLKSCLILHFYQKLVYQFRSYLCPRKPKTWFSNWSSETR